MSAIPRYVTTAEEGAARIAGYIFGDGNPEHADGPLGGTAMTALSVEAWVVPECERIATSLLGWSAGLQYRIASNGNFICLAAPLYSALSMPITGDFYHRALASIVPTRKQVEAFLASVIEGEASFNTVPAKIMDENRGGEYTQRIANMVTTMNTQSLGAFVSNIAVKCPQSLLDAFPLPLISSARYPGETPADWPDPPPAGPDTTPPPVPTGLVGVALDSEVSLSWNVVAASDLAGYRLYRDGVLTYQGTIPAFIDATVTNDVTYSYTVSAYDTTGNESVPSVPAIDTPMGAAPPADVIPPDTPTNLIGIPDVTTVALSWTASTAIDVSGYNVYRGTLLVAAVSAPTVFFSDSGLDAETVYAYRVSAVDTSGNESASTPYISVTTLFAPTGPPAITETTAVISANIGCAESYAVYIADRSGANLLTELPHTGCSWGRVQDDVSEATIQLDLVNGFDTCCQAVNGLARYGYEVVIFRNGLRVWTGPVVDILPDGENISIRAEDRFGWTRVRPIWSHIDYPDPGVDVATIFNAVLNNAMAPDNPMGLHGTATATGVRAAREYVTNPPQIAYDALQELARSGVDYTMIGPTLVAGSFVVPTPSIALLTDQALAQLPSVSILGANFGTQWFVTGDPDANLIAAYGGIDALSGLVVRIAAEDTIKDQASLNQNAKSRWELTNGPAVGEVKLVLDQSAPIPMDVCVPGAVIDLRIAETCFPLIGRYRMKAVDVEETNADDGPGETVTITVQPLGTEIIT